MKLIKILEARIKKSKEQLKAQKSRVHKKLAKRHIRKTAAKAQTDLLKGREFWIHQIHINTHEGEGKNDIDPDTIHAAIEYLYSEEAHMQMPHWSSHVFKIKERDYEDGYDQWALYRVRIQVTHEIAAELERHDFNDIEFTD